MRAIWMLLVISQLSNSLLAIMEVIVVLRQPAHVVEHWRYVLALHDSSDLNRHQLVTLMAAELKSYYFGNFAYYPRRQAWICIQRMTLNILNQVVHYKAMLNKSNDVLIPELKTMI